MLILGGIKSKRNTFLYVTLLGALSRIILVSSGSCTVAPFPIVIGGSISNTYIIQIDYHSITDRIVAVGSTFDTGINTNIFPVGG